MTDAYYYHAGVDGPPGTPLWSPSTRYSYRAAITEARRMARLCGGTPMVEYWPRSHGRRPRDMGAVEGCDFITEEE